MKEFNFTVQPCDEELEQRKVCVPVTFIPEETFSISV